MTIDLNQYPEKSCWRTQLMTLPGYVKPHRWHIPLGGLARLGHLLADKRVFFKSKVKNSRQQLIFTAFWATAFTIYLTQEPSFAQACNGFLCGAKNKIVAAPGFSNAKELINLLFMSINVLIVTALGYGAFRAISAYREGEDWKTLANGLVIAVVALLAFNYLADFIVGV